MTTIHLRTGPSTRYVSKGLLADGTKFTRYCETDSGWSYGKVRGGANSGKWGWTYADHLEWPI